MHLIAARELDASGVLQAFRHDGWRLFLGAAFTAVALIAGLLSLVRRKRDSLLLYFALFAALYGIRLWIQSDMVKLELRDSLFFPRLSASLNYLMPVPALLFLGAAGLLDRISKAAGYAVAAVGILLSVAVSFHGPAAQFDTISRASSVVGVTILVIDFARKKAPRNSDLAIVRRGFLIFAAFILFDNVVGTMSMRWISVEPLGFVVFLGSLGYVAARRTVQRDQQLSDIQNELEVAQRIQRSILPPEFPMYACFRVASRYFPMTSVAGDFYDYVVVNEQQAGLLIADVSGHGVPAALIASMVKLAAASQRPQAAQPSQFLSGMNAALCGNTQGQFVTAAYVYLDSAAQELRYSAAGHPPMLRLRDLKVTRIQENGLLLAAFDFATYAQVAHSLKHRDRLLLYTDGLVEAADDKGEFFGPERLSNQLLETAGLDVSDAADKILMAVQSWSAKQDDDLTLIVCDYVTAA
jgi:sigma-B regulation protein RsbU (phosphoserine phosphatase)